MFAVGDLVQPVLDDAHDAVKGWDVSFPFTGECFRVPPGTAGIVLEKPHFRRFGSYFGLPLSDGLHADVWFPQGIVPQVHVRALMLVQECP